MVNARDMVITSKSNPVVKELAALKEKKFRKERGTFLIEGEKMVRECLKSGVTVCRVAVREDYGGEWFSCPTVELGRDAFNFVCDEKTPQGIVAEAEIPVFPLKPPEGDALFLDGVSDPSNLGAIIRTANAAGYREIYLADCADPFSPKCVRASMSGVFFVKLMRGAREEILPLFKGTPLLAADMSGENAFTFSVPEKFVLCIGNEGNGISQDTLSKVTNKVRIPMGGNTESLNAAVSAGILMYHFHQKQFL